MAYTISNTLKSLFVAFALVIATAACDGPVGPQGDTGPQGEQGPEGPHGPAGEDGNANVTRYVFPGHDFSVDDFTTRYVGGVSESEMVESAWLVYLVRPNNPTSDRPWAVFIPGSDGSDSYNLNMLWFSGNPARAQIRIWNDGGTGREYDSIHVIRVKEGTAIDCPSPTDPCSGLRTNSEALIPADLDVSDYRAVVNFYGLDEGNTIRM